MIRCGCFLFALALFLVGTGAQGVWTAAVHGKRKDVTYSQFMAARPNAGWYRIKGGALNVLDAVWSENKRSKEIKTVYVPLKSPDKLTDPNTHVLVKTEDAGVISVLTQRQAISDADEQAQRKFVKQHLSELVLARDVEGTIQTGLDAMGGDRDKVAKNHDGLDKDFVILEDGVRPSMGASVAKLIGGLVLLVLIGGVAVSRSGKG